MKPNKSKKSGTIGLVIFIIILLLIGAALIGMALDFKSDAEGNQREIDSIDLSEQKIKEGDYIHIKHNLVKVSAVTALMNDYRETPVGYAFILENDPSYVFYIDNKRDELYNYISTNLKMGSLFDRELIGRANRIRDADVPRFLFDFAWANGLKEGSPPITIQLGVSQSSKLWPFRITIVLSLIPIIFSIFLIMGLFINKPNNK